MISMESETAIAVMMKLVTKFLLLIPLRTTMVRKLKMTPMMWRNDHNQSLLYFKVAKKKCQNATIVPNTPTTRGM